MALRFFYGGHTYQLVLTAQTWSSSKAYAESQGGHLAYVGSATENTTIYNNASVSIPISEAPYAQDGGNAVYLWLGASDITSEGAWKWGDGSSLTSYANWGSGSGITEPDNSYGIQDALGMGLVSWPWPSGGIGTPGEWNDIDPANSLYSVIEWDYLRGTSSADTITGTTGNDTLVGLSGSDLLEGGAGDDFLVGGDGNDTINGGSGVDMVDYSASVGSVSVNLSLASNQTTGADGTDQLFNIEEVRASAHADTLTGDNYDNWFRGMRGNDTINGGNGWDTADYQEATGAVFVNLALTSNQATGADGIDQLINIEEVHGGNYADKLTGDSYDNWLRGGLGNDTLNGGGGWDVADYKKANGSVTVNLSAASNQATGADGTDQLVNIKGVRGGNYADTLSGDGNDNWFRGMRGNDTINGGDGWDTADYKNATGAVFVNLALASNQATGADGTDQLIGIEEVRGSNFADKLTGDSQDNWLRGGLGNDTLTGGGGWDCSDYRDANGAVVVNLSLASNQATGADGTDQLISIEEVRGSAYADKLTGDGNDNWFRGMQGNDTINGGAGWDWADYRNANGSVTVNLSLASNQATGADGTDQLTNIEYVGGSAYADKLTGDGNENWFRGMQGNDTINGGAGWDWADYRSANGSVTVNLSLTSNQATGADGTDQLVSIERIRGSDYADRLTGNGGDNRLRGMKGNDTLDGGAGSDYADYWSAGGAVVVNLSLASNQATGADGVDQLFNIENIRGSDYADRLTGNSGDNILRGKLGNDTLDGGAGVDTADYTDASGAVFVNLSLSSAQTNGADGADQLVNIENVRGSDFADTITGNAIANTLDGGAGLDTMLGGAGNDIYYVDNTGDRVYETTTTTSTTNAGGTDKVISSVSFSLSSYTGVSFIEKLTLSGAAAINATGNALANTLVGNSAANILTGGAGSDNLNGGTGADTLVINAVVGTSSDSSRTVVTGLNNDKGQDTLTAFSLTEDTIKVVATNVTSFVHGTDTTIGAGSGAEIAGNNASFSKATGLIELNQTTNNNWADAGDIAVTFATPSATLTEANFEARLQYSLTGTTAANTLTGGRLSDTLRGGSGNDTLTGSSGNDTLYGDSGNDLLRGGAGNDILYGGTGQDLFRLDYALSKTANVDQIKDFVVADDTIQLENAIFTKFGTSTTGTINSSYFKAITTGGATDSNDYIVYNKSTGGLYYDADGGADGNADAIQIALLGTKPVLTYADFALV